MSDSGSQKPNTQGEVSPSPKQQPTRQRVSMFADPVVRGMVWAAFAVVVLFLASVVGALFFGVLNSPAPRTAAERAVDFAGGAVNGGDHSAKALADYVNALIDVGQFGKAQGIIDNAPATARNTRTGDLEVAQARLLYARKDYAGAIAAADKAAKGIKVIYDIDVKKKGDTNYAKAYGLDANYYDAFLIKGLAQQDSGDHKGAIASFTTYLEKNSMESNVIVDRAESKLALGDTAGAKADFKDALKYVPDMQRALDGLKKIGAQ